MATNIETTVPVPNITLQANGSTTSAPSDGIEMKSLAHTANGSSATPPLNDPRSEKGSLKRGIEGFSEKEIDQDAFEPFFMFYSIDAERLESYKGGAFFPVHLGELYRNRYRIMLKIGYGSYSTVWFAVDLRTRDYVALKFLEAGEENESRIHYYIQSTKDHEGQESTSGHDNSNESHGPDQDRQRYIVPLLDSFTVGTENQYTVLVSPVLIPLHRLDENQRLGLNIKMLIFQLLQAMSFLHSKRITHGDLHPGNIALRVKKHLHDVDDLHMLDESRIIPVVPDESSPHCAVSRSFKCYPKYLVSNKSFLQYVNYETKPVAALSAAEIRVIDLGNSYIGQLPVYELPTTHRQVRGPEFAAHKVKGGNIPGIGGSSSDVWSTACTMFHLVFGQTHLFECARSSPEKFLREVERKIGQLPSAWQLPIFEISEHIVGCIDLTITPEGFWEGLKEQYQGTWSREELGEFLRLVRAMLALDPVRRPTIDQVLMDKWFDDVRGNGKGERARHCEHEEERDPKSDGN